MKRISKLSQIAVKRQITVIKYPTDKMADYCGACYCPKVYCRGCKGYHCKCSWSGRRCRTAFRKHLNETTTLLHRERRFMQRTRPYGDYLYYQDREKFEMEFKEWKEAMWY